MHAHVWAEDVMHGRAGRVGRGGDAGVRQVEWRCLSRGTLGVDAKLDHLCAW